MSPLRSAIIAMEALDLSLERLVRGVLERGGVLVITADHGNCEQMLDTQTSQPHTAHTCEPVPLIYYGPQTLTLAAGGSLKDVAPTLLDLMHLEPPEEMNGRSLVTFQAQRSA